MRQPADTPMPNKKRPKPCSRDEATGRHTDAKQEAAKVVLEG